LNTSEVSTEATAVVVAGDEGTRVLLRGLLRIHHFRVPGDAGGAGEGLELLRNHRPALMVVDVFLVDGNPVTLVAEARAIVPKLRVILVASASDPPAFPPDSQYRPDVVLLRPFRIRDFAEAVLPGKSNRTGEGSDA